MRRRLARALIAGPIRYLVWIGRKDQFLDNRSGGKERTRQVGKVLHALGGIELMRAVHAEVRRQLPYGGGRSLELAWDGIGSWQK